MTMITALMDLSKMPNQSQDQATFDANWAYVLENLLLRGQQENGLVAALNAIAAGGAYAFPYIFDSATADADPGLGRVRFNSTTQNLAGGLRFDTGMVGGTDITPVFSDLGAGTSAVKGSVRIVKQSDPSRWIVFDITAVTSPSGYRNLNVVGKFSTHANPFTHDDPVLVYFQRTGDKGDTGPLNSYPAMYVQETLGSTSSPTYAVGSWVTRSLNSVRSNTISGASLSSNAVTLPAGTYDYEAYVSGYNSQFQCRFRNVTDGTTLENGSSEYVSGSSVTTKSFVKGRITISATKTFQVEVYFTSGGGGGYAAGNGSGLPTVFSELKITKVA